MSSWMQYEATKFAYEEQKRQHRELARHAVPGRAGLARRLAAWSGALLLGYGQRLMSYGRRGGVAALRKSEMSQRLEKYRLN
jgi:hypothetical protein